MRPSIPSANAVDSGLRRVLKRLGAVRKVINASAAKEMKSDQYETAQMWMEMGRSVGDFAQRLDTFADEWQRLVRATRIMAQTHPETQGGKRITTHSAKRTPSWKFCAPALKALVAREGTASLPQLIEDLNRDLAAVLTTYDRSVPSGRSVPRWHGAIDQAYRQCQKETWIEKRRDGVWKITPKGIAVAGESKSLS